MIQINEIFEMDANGVAHRTVSYDFIGECERGRSNTELVFLQMKYRLIGVKKILPKQQPQHGFIGFPYRAWRKKFG